MYPEICRIGPLTVYSYGLMLVVAFLSAGFLAARRAAVEGIDPDAVYSLTFYALLAGIAGARIFFVLGHLSFYLEAPREIFQLQRGGLSWFGGLLGGLGAAVWYLRRRRLGIMRTSDCIIPFVALAHAIGRIGCFLNGCCAGRESVFGLYFPVHQAVLVPVQLYASLFLVAIFVLLRIVQERPHREGDVFFAYLLCYGILRFFLEFWRSGHAVVFAGLTLFQLLSTGLVVIALIKLSVLRRQ
ncbi:MAG: prolipoprotein diacylglyceryl transferase [Candidatus Omnitrophica bacterium]|nr:prolipoprotein diacylglyceryl transferase [Candidatus Omnitrophota bacterium]